MSDQYWDDESFRYHRECTCDTDEDALKWAKADADMPKGAAQVAEWLRIKAEIGHELYSERDLLAVADMLIAATERAEKLQSEVAERDRTIGTMSDRVAYLEAWREYVLPQLSARRRTQAHTAALSESGEKEVIDGN